MQPGLGYNRIQVLVGVALQVSCERAVESAGNEFVAGAHDKSSSQPRSQQTSLPVADGHHLAVENIHPREVPKLAEHWAVALLMNTPRVAEFGAVPEPFRNAEGMNVPDHVGRVHKVVTDSGMGEEVILCRVDHVRGGCDESASLSFE